MSPSPAYQQFELSFNTRDRQWMEDFDLDALTRLDGIERSLAEDLLMQRLEGGRDPRAARALGVLGSRQAIPALRLAAIGTVDEARLESIAALLRLTGEQDLIDLLMPLLLQGAVSIRIRAARYAERFEPVRANRLLVQALHDTDPLVRSNAAASLIGLHRLEGMEKARGSLLWRLTFRLSLKFQACWSQAAEALQALFEALAQGQTSQSLGITPDGLRLSPEGASFFESVACDPGEDPWPDTMDLDALKRLTGDEREMLVDSVFSALGMGDTRAPAALVASGDARAVSALTEALASTSGMMQLEVGLALLRLTGSPDARRVVTLAAQGSDATLRTRAMIGLKQLGPQA